MKKIILLAALLILFRSGLNERNAVSKSAYSAPTLSDSIPTSVSFNFEDESMFASFEFKFCSEYLATLVVFDYINNQNSKTKKTKNKK